MFLIANMNNRNVFKAFLIQSAGILKEPIFKELRRFTGWFRGFYKQGVFERGFPRGLVRTCLYSTIIMIERIRISCLRTIERFNYKINIYIKILASSERFLIKPGKTIRGGLRVKRGESIERALGRRTSY